MQRSSTSISRERRSVDPFLIAGVLAGPIFIAGYTIQDLTRHGFDPMRGQVSELALGYGGWQQVVNFLVSGVLLLAFGVGLLRMLKPRRLVPLMIVVSGLAFIVAACFATGSTNGYQPGGVTGQSGASGIHDLAAGAWFLSLTIAGIASGLHFLRHGRPPLGVYSIASVIAMLGFVTVSSIGYARVPGFVDVAGLFERLSLMSGLIWVTVLAIDQIRAQEL